MADHFLLAYFLTEKRPDGEQVRFAVSAGPEPADWTLVNGGDPVLPLKTPDGARDPFLTRDPSDGSVVLLATDLRVNPDENWAWAMSRASRSIHVWRSDDLVDWSRPRRKEIAPAEAGNAWAPKAFWSAERNTWLVFFASALFEEGSDRSAGTYQRILVAETADFDTFGPARVHIDAGHSVIDMTFLRVDDVWYRFSVNAHPVACDDTAGSHIFEEVGSGLEATEFQPLVVDVGRDVLAHAEGPAVAKHPGEDRWFLLADEYGLSGYHLFETLDLRGGVWTHRPDAPLPNGARHGSLLAITADERDRLLTARWPTTDLSNWSMPDF